MDAGRPGPGDQQCLSKVSRYIIGQCSHLLHAEQSFNPSLLPLRLWLRRICCQRKKLPYTLLSGCKEKAPEHGVYALD